jgi:SSS family solute:Na+ symporter
VFVTVVVSMATVPKSAAELEGLVMGATRIPKEDSVGLFRRPVFWGAISIGALAVLQWIFW